MRDASHRKVRHNDLPLKLVVAGRTIHWAYTIFRKDGSICEAAEITYASEHSARHAGEMRLRRLTAAARSTERMSP